MKVLKMLIGLLLTVPCVIISQVLWGLLRTAQPDVGALPPPPALALFAGLGLWLGLFTLFPRPVRSYILAHELTHALWGLLMGASISRIRIKGDRGSVNLSKNNFLITLSPYFFPLYTVLVIAVYGGLWLFVDASRWYLLWLGLVGATWGFHLTFTVSALLQRQSDIQAQGRLFAYAVIYLANVLGICLWVIAVSPAGLHDFTRLAVRHSSAAAERLATVAEQLANAAGHPSTRHP